ncbi:MAG: hypothetical protein H0U57_11075 [Tatlockia sp.]|nr:hypothetical protein [Tatlockia sp.]
MKSKTLKSKSDTAIYKMPDSNKDESKTERSIKKQPRFKIEPLSSTLNNVETDEDLILNFDFNTLDKALTSTATTNQSIIVDHLLEKNAVSEVAHKFDGKFESERLEIKSNSKIRPETTNIRRKERSKSLTFWESSKLNKAAEEKKLEQKNHEESQEISKIKFLTIS